MSITKKIGSPTPKPRLRWPLVAAMMLGCQLLAPLSTHAQGQTQTLPASVQATLTQCQSAPDQSDRSATFSGQMTAIATTQRMAIRVEVQERLLSETSFHTINGPGLGVWRSSESGVKIYKYLRQVTNLPAPGEFRAIVSFRWLALKGRLIHQTARHTQTCEQPDERPKLVVGQVTASPISGSSSAEYHITVHNEGHGAASPFGALLSVNGKAQPALEVPSLEAGANTVLTDVAPICEVPGNIEVSLDPGHQIEESPGGGLPALLACPLASS